MRIRSLAALTVVPLAVSTLSAVPADAATVTVNRAPGTIAGNRTGIGSAVDVETDRAGKIYVLTRTGVRVFAASARGNTRPARSFATTPTSGQSTSKIAVGADGWSYVLSVTDDFTDGSIAVFGPTGTRRGTYDAADLDVSSPSDLTVVGSQVAVLSGISSDVSFFDLHQGDVTRRRYLQPGSATGSQTKIDNPSVIDSDRAGRVALAGPGWASVFAPGADSTTDPDTAPVQYVAGSRTGSGDPMVNFRVASGVGLDARGRLHVLTEEFYAIDDVTFRTQDPRLAVFAPGATGNRAPSALLRGARARLGNLSGLDVAPSGTLVTHPLAADAGSWAPIVMVHRPLGPYAAPTKPRKVKVTGQGLKRRTVSWKAARTSGDTPVRGYDVSVTCVRGGQGSGTSTTVAAGRRSFRVPVSRGRCTVKVAAFNQVGTGKPATVRFTVG